MLATAAEIPLGEADRATILVVEERAPLFTAEHNKSRPRRHSQGEMSKPSVILA